MNFKTLTSKLHFKKAQKDETKVPTPAEQVSDPAFKKKHKKQAIFFVRFPIKEQVHFAKRLSFLIGAGVSILDSLTMLKNQARSSSQKYIYGSVITDVTNGLFLSAGLAKFERFFGTFAINIIKVGETSGSLTQNLNYLADELRKKEALRKKVVGALIYPIFITIATLILAGSLTVFIFPKVMPIFKSLDVGLPITTVILLAISDFLSAYGLHLMGGIIIFVIIIRLMIRTLPPFRFIMHRVSLHLPIFGKLMKYYFMTNFCRTLGLLLKSGVNVVEAIEITGDTLGNDVYKAECKKIAKIVMRGEKISTHLSKRPFLFPDFTAHLIAVGEETGSLSDTLIYLSEMYESETSDMTNNLSNSIEPVLMIFMGLIVGFVAVSVIAPIYEVTQNLNP